VSDYSNPEVLVRTTVDISSTRIVVLAFVDRVRQRCMEFLAALVFVRPEEAHAQGLTWGCVRDALLGVGSLVNLVRASAHLVTAASATGASAGLTTPWLGGATYDYLASLAAFTVLSANAFVSCQGSGKKTVVAKN
jgi:hypothetical protein